MKKPNKNVTKLIAGTLATSILTNSCSSYFQDDSIYNESNFSEKGESAILIKYSPEEIKYLNFLDKLGKDIISHPIIAREFAKNPNLFLQRYGYDKEVDLDEGMLKLILALGDEDINLALKNEDVKKVLLLMKEKNLLQSSSYMNINITDQEKNNMLSLLGVDEKDFEQYGVCTLAVVCLAYIWVGVVSQAVAIYTAAAAVDLAVAIAVYYYAAAVTQVSTGGGGKSNAGIEGSVYPYGSTGFIDKNPIFKVWGLKGDYKNTYIAADIFIEEEVNQLADGLETALPNAFEKIPKERFKQFMKLNLLKSK